MPFLYSHQLLRLSEGVRTQRCGRRSLRHRSKDKSLAGVEAGRGRLFLRFLKASLMRPAEMVTVGFLAPTGLLGS